MRISDWSSDVCSSDLSDPTLRRRPVRGIAMTASVGRLRRSAFSYLLGFGLLVAASFLAFGAVTAPAWGQSTETPAAGPTGGAVPGNVQRSEARRVGEERVRSCRSRGSPDH